jgi:hypothetical protein
MSTKKGNINGKKGQQGNNTWAGTDIFLKPGDSALFGKISDSMRGYLDIEDVKNDPLFKEADDAAREMIPGFDNEAPVHKAYAKFIRENISGENDEEKLVAEINDIKREGRENDVDKITAGWVKEYNGKQQIGVSPDPKSEERREFITDSLEEPKIDYERNPVAGNKKSFKKTIQSRFALPAAAAVIGAIFLVRLLLPSHDPDKLFTKYYEPLSAISPVTRDANAAEANSYASAIESYNNKNYQAAARGFADAILQDPMNIPARFFMGITQVALGNYNQAENILEDVISRQGEYVKEARWYLGLAYIKTGNPEKASGCFTILSQSPGYYSGRAEKILRRLR